MYKNKLYLLILIILLSANVLNKEVIEGKVVRVMDGDTIEILVNGKTKKVRLHGIDAPEQKQAFGYRAKVFASDACFGKIVKVKSIGKDRYGRVLGVVILPNGKNLNQELVKAGLAWRFKYSKDKTLEQLEAKARSEKKGLWVDPHPISPYDFRHKKK